MAILPDNFTYRSNCSSIPSSILHHPQAISIKNLLPFVNRMLSNFPLSKLYFYLSTLTKEALPSRFLRTQLFKLLHQSAYHEDPECLERVHYYNKCLTGFKPNGTKLSDISLRKHSAYALDLRSLTRYFPQHLTLSYKFGDIRKIPHTPTIVKSRPISPNNMNSILLRLNSVRHFRFANDKTHYRDKKDMLVWRGAAYQPQRIQLLQTPINTTICDIKPSKIDSNNHEICNLQTEPHWMSLQDQLSYKFILSVEGNDVATNLKWILSSQSLCFMAKPKYETWFMEGTLQAGHHYVQINDDFSDLEDKVAYYLDHPNEAMEIISAANNYCKKFVLPNKERYIGLMVLNKYFELTGQLLS